MLCPSLCFTLTCAPSAGWPATPARPSLPPPPLPETQIPTFATERSHCPILVPGMGKDSMRGESFVAQFLIWLVSISNSLGGHPWEVPCIQGWACRTKDSVPSAQPVYFSFHSLTVAGSLPQPQSCLHFSLHPHYIPALSCCPPKISPSSFIVHQRPDPSPPLRLPQKTSCPSLLTSQRPPSQESLPNTSSGGWWGGPYRLLKSEESLSQTLDSASGRWWEEWGLLVLLEALFQMLNSATKEGGEGCAMLGGLVLIVLPSLYLALLRDSLLELSNLLSLGELWAGWVEAWLLWEIAKGMLERVNSKRGQ